MWWVGYGSYKNMYENRNVHLYFTDFFHVSYGINFYIIFCTDIDENQVHPLSLQYPMLWSVGCTTRNVVAWWWPFNVWPGSARHMPHQDLCPTNATQPTPGLAAANRGRDGTRPHRLLIGIGLCGFGLWNRVAHCKRDCLRDTATKGFENPQFRRHIIIKHEFDTRGWPTLRVAPPVTSSESDLGFCHHWVTALSRLCGLQTTCLAFQNGAD